MSENAVVSEEAINNVHIANAYTRLKNTQHTTITKINEKKLLCHLMDYINLESSAATRTICHSYNVLRR